MVLEGMTEEERRTFDPIVNPVAPLRLLNKTGGLREVQGGKRACEQGNREALHKVEPFPRGGSGNMPRVLSSRFDGREKNKKKMQLHSPIRSGRKREHFLNGRRTSAE